MKMMRGLVLICILAVAAGPLAAFARQDKNVDKAAAKSRAEEMKKAANPGAVPQVGDKKDEAKKEEPRKPEPFSTPTFNGLRFRLIGPAFTSGRVVAIAVDPTDHTHYFVGAASGGVWKTTNAGTTWSPVFDNEGSYSIGVIVIDPKNPLTVWVGAGENNSQRSVSYGDGVYRSDDGGKTWKNMGLKTSEHIGQITIDPRDSNVVYVAAQGMLWGPGGERGLFKTTDGGKTWKAVLTISENTGVTDVAIDPNNPDTLYAASYQRRRHVYTLVNGGPESALYKSTDAGATWNKLRAGLPNSDMGRIGIAISPMDSNIIYASVEAADRKGGIFRSSDRGASWERRNPYDAGAMYYGHIYCDPKEADRIYVPNVLVMVSDDGGRTLRPLGERSKHVDNHVIWIDPANTNRYLVGCDGGVYESFDRGATWDFKANLPIPQFYDVTTDNATPFYNVYGGTQDNYSMGGPARTRSVSGIVNSDWFVTQGGDGFRSQVDPEDPNTVYAELQYGVLVRFDRRTGERMGITPAPGRGEEALRVNWDAPFIISPHSRTRLYYASNKLFRSDDRGDTWTLVSNDLTRQLDRNKLPVFNKIMSVDAVARHTSTDPFGNASALFESPKKEGLVYVGTDDGLIQVTEDAGKNWRKMDTFPGVPEMTYVSRIVASQHDAGTVYAAFDNHKRSDFAPYLLKSTDAGRSWTSIASNLPKNGPVLAIAEDHVNPNLIFVGTEFGVFFTIDGGKKWVQLKGGLPTIAVRDIAIQRRENDLVLATFGRGIYILDDYTSLRNLKPEMLTQEAALFPVKDALMYIQSQPLGGRGKSFQGESFYTADNPPFGATFTYYLKEAPKTRKQLRQEAEKEAEKKGQPLYQPTLEELRAEDEEEAPAIIFTVKDSEGHVVRRLVGPAVAGFNRSSWDLRYSTPVISQRPPAPEEEIFGEPPAGPLVMPGKYSVSLARRVAGTITPLGVAQEFTITVDGQGQMNPVDRAALVEFQQKVARLQRAVTGALETANQLKTRLALIKRALQETPAADFKLTQDAQAIERQLDDILRALRGDQTARSRSQETPPSINDRVGTILGEQRMSTSRPTRTQQDHYAAAAADFETALAALRALVEGDLARLEKAMEAAGAPWTPGRIPEWKNN
ncbi:MAG TPA: glycosyl hydrolase [Blastocatellia bacterium]|nr:glycosyl hydrolase [Blastocatellia bacterium]